MKVFYIDLFCGAGGTSTGIHHSNSEAEVVACVNHDAKAIESHKANNKNCLHLTEDVRDLKVIARLKILVDNLRKKHPGCIINIWASLECTNYSKAKGGLPRDADSRTLAHTLYLYIEALDPDYIYIENVREFMAWGPLDKNGRPVSRKNGADYVKWCNTIQEYGYSYDFKLLNAADFGAYTSRLRYFGQFAKIGMPIAWPEETHCKKIVENEGLFVQKKKKWKPVKEVLDLKDEGNSIFTRKKALSENTHKRILAGLIKFVAGGEAEFTKVYNSGNDEQRVKSVNEPIGSLTTQNSHAVVKSVFIQQRNSGNPESKLVDVEGPARTITKTAGNQEVVKAVFMKHSHGGKPSSKVWGIDGPNRTLTTYNNHYVVKNVFLNSYYGSGGSHDTESPSPTLTTKDRISKIDAQFLVNNYGNGGQLTPLENPAPTVMSNPKSSLLIAKPWLLDTNFNNTGNSLDKPNPTILASRKQQYLMNPQFSNKGASIDKPSFTLIARMDKKPPYLISTEAGELCIAVFESDDPTMIKIKEFMAIYGIVDIKMRMLKIDELLNIQGFPSDYKLIGTKTEQKKFIGNSVVPIVAQKLVESNYQAIKSYLEKAA